MIARPRINEREHRRGLVLGLTLAEALLLLLFLLLLAMGAKIERQERELSLALPAPAPSWSLPENVVIAEPFGANVELTGVVIGSPMETGSINTPEDLALKGALESLGKLAAEFDKNDAPATLKKMQATIAALPRNKTALEELKVSLEKLENRKPGGSIDELKRAIAVLEHLPPDARPADVAIKKADKEEGKEHPNWPPIITLTSDELKFPSGGAELSSSQRDQLSGSVVDELMAIIEKHSDVNVIEVIGHTDEQPIGVRPSNLDGSLFARVRGSTDRPEMISADNAGLGLARAVAVAEVLLQQTRLTRFRILPLSGAQLIDTNDDLSDGSGPKDAENRRRIEIRVRRTERGVPGKHYDRPPLQVYQAKPKQTDGGDWNPFLWKF